MHWLYSKVNHAVAPYSLKWLTDVRSEPFVPYVVNTNSAHQLKFTKRKSSHTSVNITQHPTKRSQNAQ